MLRVLIVDDSPTACKILADILGSDPELTVVGKAANGREAVAMAERLRPDVITMDIHMPLMDGFEATKEIMIENPTPIVIVSSSTRVHEVEAGLQALQAGALSLALKPGGPASPDFERSAKELINTVKAMAEVKVIRRRRPADAASVELATPGRGATSLRAVAITASTGGPPALHQVLSGLPADFPVPILIVQHIASGFIDGFVNWLDSVVPLHVQLAEEQELLQPGRVYVASEQRHLGVTRGGRLALSDDPPINGFRPAGTFLFESVADAFRRSVVAVILTGMGRDGVDGLRAVRNAGGLVLAQDEQSCVVHGMPKAAVDEGLVDAVVPLTAISRYLLDLVARQVH